MRWDGLFADLEAQLGTELAAEERAIEADEIRVDRGRRDLVSRLADLTRGGAVALRLVDGSTTTVRIDAVGDGWVSGRRVDGTRRLIVPVEAIVTGRGAGGTAQPEVDRTRLGLRIVLRDLARRRAGVSVATRVATLHGTVDAVGGDHLELAVHPEGTPRRAREVSSLELIPLAALVSVAY